MALSQIEFYKQHKISPVRQDIGDLDKHFERRAALYRHLGILPAFIRGKKVLEVGPGSGFNSLYTSSLQPSAYVLVEGNPTGVEDLHTLFSEYPALSKNIRIAPVLLDDYDEDDQFDFVFCEGVLSSEPTPTSTLKGLTKFVAPQGTLVITSEDSVSLFPLTLRRLFAQVILDPTETLDGQVAKLLPVFGPHLSRLLGMSRRHDDWIVDNLINPAILGELLSLPEAISVIEDEFDIYATSPHFLSDWRWYKVITAKGQSLNRLAINQYWQNIHNFLDHRAVFPPRAEDQNRQLHDLCSSVRGKISLFENSRDVRALPDIVNMLGQVVGLVQEFSVKLADALKEAQSLLADYPVDQRALADSSKFGGLFARAQQYLSFSRRN